MYMSINKSRTRKSNPSLIEENPHSSKKRRTQKENQPPIEIRVGIENKDYYLTQMEKRQGEKHIYKIEYFVNPEEICVNYIDDANPYVVFKDMDKHFVIIGLPGSYPDESTIKRCQAALVRRKTIGTKNVQLVKDAILLESCAPEIDLSKAQTIIEELNEKLAKKCPELFIKLAPYYDYLEPLHRYGQYGHICIGCQYYNTLILALCNSEKCISSIELLMVHDGEIMMNSKTDSEEEGKKYNKLLRAVLSIVGEKIPGMRYLKSKAMNPVSAWLLLSYSGARIEEGDEFADYANGKKITKDLINSYYTPGTYKEIKLLVDLNEDNTGRSMREFNKLVAGVAEELEIRC